MQAAYGHNIMQYMHSRRSQEKLLFEKYFRKERSATTATMAVRQAFKYLLKNKWKKFPLCGQRRGDNQTT